MAQSFVPGLPRSYDVSSMNQDSFDEYRSLLIEHLEEEERDLVPQMRRHFTQAEERQVGRQLPASFGSSRPHCAQLNQDSLNVYRQLASSNFARVSAMPAQP